MTIVISFFDNVDEAVEYSQKMLYGVEEEEPEEPGEEPGEEEGSEEDSDEEPEEPEQEEDEPFKCNCGKTFKKESWYEKHLKKCPDRPKRKYVHKKERGLTPRQEKVKKAVKVAKKMKMSISDAAKEVGLKGFGGTDYYYARKFGYVSSGKVRSEQPVRKERELGPRQIKIKEAVEIALKKGIKFRDAAKEIGITEFTGGDYKFAKKCGYVKPKPKKKYSEEEEKKAFIRKRTTELCETGFEWDEAKASARVAWDNGERDETWNPKNE